MESTSSGPHLLLTGVDGDRSVPLLGATSWKLGRGSQSSIILVDDLVSRTHAMIQRMDNGEYFLIDMGSRNGSFVNEKRVSIPIALRDGDRLTLGNAQLIFCNPLELTQGDALPPADSDATVFHIKQCMVSVLVIDIREFTVLSQDVSNAVLCQVTGAWFGEADRIMRSRGSVAQKYIGDAVMAVWMHRVKGQESLEILEILRALCEFADYTENLSARFRLPHGVRIGAGLNTGMAALGNTGTNHVHDYTATGECVNTAFRLESATKTLQTDLCVGMTTGQYLRNLPKSSPYFQKSEVEMKGYSTPVQACPATFKQLKTFLDSISDVVTRKIGV